MNSEPFARAQLNTIIVPNDFEGYLLVAEVGNGVGFGGCEGATGRDEDLGV